MTFNFAFDALNAERGINTFEISQVALREEYQGSKVPGNSGAHVTAVRNKRFFKCAIEFVKGAPTSPSYTPALKYAEGTKPTLEEAIRDVYHQTGQSVPEWLK